MKSAVPWGKLVGLVVVLGVFSVAVRVLPTGEWVSNLTEWAAAQGWAGIAVFVLLYALATVAFFPGSLLSIGAGLAFGLGKGVVAVSAGSTIGASLAFLIARYFARARVEVLAQKNARFRAIDEAIGQRGWKIVALLRLSPLLPFNLSNYLYGITRVGFWPYVAASWAGMLPGTFLYVYLGAAGKAAAGGGDNPWKWVLFGAGLLATIGVTVWISRVAKRAIAEGEGLKS